jgi:hypothetical protein
MAQVWLTFEEIQDLFGCDAADARRRVIANQWERRRCTDGLFRAQLPPEAAHEYMLRYRGTHEQPAIGASNFEAAMAALRRVFAEAEAEDSSQASAATVRPHAWPQAPRSTVLVNGAAMAGRVTDAVRNARPIYAPTNTTCAR